MGYQSLVVLVRSDQYTEQEPKAFAVILHSCLLVAELPAFVARSCLTNGTCSAWLRTTIRYE